MSKLNTRGIKDAVAFLASPEGEAQTKKVIACIVNDAAALCRIANTAFQEEDPRRLVGILLPNTFSLFTKVPDAKVPDTKEAVAEEADAEEADAEEADAEEADAEPAVTLREPSYYEAYSWRRV